MSAKIVAGADSLTLLRPHSVGLVCRARPHVHVTQKMCVCVRSLWGERERVRYVCVPMLINTFYEVPFVDVVPTHSRGAPLEI